MYRFSIAKFSTLTLAGVIVAAGLFGAALSFSTSHAQTYPIACTMEAKLCPDGSYVGRGGPNCEFAPCPGGNTGSCVVITSALFYGSTDARTGGDVTKLQSFLTSRGYYNGAVIGIFGPVTRAAVIRFQSANGISPIGIVGPVTRAAIQRISCGGNPPPTQGISVTSVAPQSGSVGTQIVVRGYGFTSDNTIVFTPVNNGAGYIVHVPSYDGVTLMFAVPDGLNPLCFYSNPRCLIATRQTAPGPYTIAVQITNGTSNTASFTVTSNTQNNLTIQSVQPTSGAVGASVTIFGTGFTGSNNIKFDSSDAVTVASSNGTSLTFTVPAYIRPYCPPGAYCFVYQIPTQPMTYSVTVQNENGTSNAIKFTVTSTTSGAPTIQSIAPTSGSVGSTVTLYGSGFNSASILRFSEGSVPHSTSADGTQITFTVPQAVGPYCAPNMMCAMYMRQVTPGQYNVSVQNTDGSVSSNTVTFTVTDTGGQITINGVDAPASLSVGQQGTWTVRATVPGNPGANLHYSVVWGDEGYYYPPYMQAGASQQIQTSATFSHVYQRSGYFTPSFTVTNDFGASASATASVNVF